MSRRRARAPWPSSAQVAQLLWAVPLALWADRGSRKVVAGVALLVFAGLRAA